MNESTPPSAESPETPTARRRKSAALFGGLLLLGLLLQWHAGAYQSDFGGHADEAAHVVTGLMVRDYLAGGILKQPHPMRFAEDYYERFPKVAIGHYPPLFYLVEGVWLVPFRSGNAVLFLMAVLSALTGWLTWRAGREFLPDPASVASAFIVVLLPLVRTYSAVVMADLLLVILCLAATMSLGRFLESPKWRDSLWFGIFAAAAILTKGSGLLLAFVPPIAIMLTGKFDILKNGRLWIAPVPVLLFAFPWILFTRHITAEGMTTMPLAGYVSTAATFYGKALWRELGPGVLLILVLSIGYQLVKASREKRPLSPQPSVHIATLLALLVFFCVVPSGLDARYLLPAIPAVTLSLFALRPPVLHWGVIVLVCLFSLIRPVSKLYTGAADSIAAVAEVQDTGQASILVSSSPNGEGALIAAAALGDPDQFHMIRASKELAQSDWLGRGYRDRFEDEASLAAHLNGGTIGFIIVDRNIPETQRLPYHDRLNQAIDAHPGIFRSIGRVVSRRKVYGGAEFEVFRVRHSESLDFQEE